LVAASTITFVLVPKPSISVSNWFKVFSLSSFHLTYYFFLWLYLPSISSMKIIAGDFSFVWTNRGHEKLLHLQTFQQNQILIKRKKGTCASPATALLIRFFLFLEALQVRLLLNFTSRLVYFSGFFKILQFLVFLLSHPQVLLRL
jgi:hypothetical protein